MSLISLISQSQQQNHFLIAKALCQVNSFAIRKYFQERKVREAEIIVLLALGLHPALAHDAKFLRPMNGAVSFGKNTMKNIKACAELQDFMNSFANATIEDFEFDARDEFQEAAMRYLTVRLENPDYVARLRALKRN
jgi:hypothetical protein